MPPPTKAPALLPEGILEEIFLRLPPDEPACLVRVSLTSKLWLRLLTGHGFRGRYREFHGAPPRLGFVYSVRPYTRFVSTSKFGAHILKDVKSHVMDCRHGRVLMDKREEPMKIVVWDPMTRYRSELHSPEGHYFSHAAAVLCAVTGCDHRACHQEGPFQVVFVGLKYAGGYKAYAHVSLPEVGEWSDLCSCLDLGSDAKDPSFVPMAPVLIQDAVYFMFADYVYGDHEDNIDYVRIIKYDLRSKRLSLIDAPPEEIDGAVVDSTLMGMEDGSLGFVHMEGFILNLWSRQVSSDEVAAWTPRIVIDLKEFLPIQMFCQTLTPIGCVDRSDIVFVRMEIGIYEINLKSLQWKKIWKRENIDLLIPYMSFYNR